MLWPPAAKALTAALAAAPAVAVASPSCSASVCASAAEPERAAVTSASNPVKPAVLKLPAMASLPAWFSLAPFAALTPRAAAVCSAVLAAPIVAVTAPGFVVVSTVTWRKAFATVSWETLAARLPFVVAAVLSAIITVSALANAGFNSTRALPVRSAVPPAIAVWPSVKAPRSTVAVSPDVAERSMVPVLVSCVPISRVPLLLMVAALFAPFSVSVPALAMVPPLVTSPVISAVAFAVLLNVPTISKAPPTVRSALLVNVSAAVDVMLTAPLKSASALSVATASLATVNDSRLWAESTPVIPVRSTLVEPIVPSKVTSVLAPVTVMSPAAASEALSAIISPFTVCAAPPSRVMVSVLPPSSCKIVTIPASILPPKVAPALAEELSTPMTPAFTLPVTSSVAPSSTIRSPTAPTLLTPGAAEILEASVEPTVPLTVTAVLAPVATTRVSPSRSWLPGFRVTMSPFTA